MSTLDLLDNVEVLRKK